MSPEQNPEIPVTPPMYDAAMKAARAFCERIQQNPEIANDPEALKRLMDEITGL